MSDVLDAAERQYEAKEKIKKLKEKAKEDQTAIERAAAEEERRIKDKEFKKQAAEYHKRVMEEHPAQAFMDHIVSQLETNPKVPGKLATQPAHGGSKTHFVLYGGSTKLAPSLYYMDDYPGFQASGHKKDVDYDLYYCGDICIQLKEGPFKDWWVVKKVPIKADIIFLLILPVFCTTITLQKKSPYWVVNGVL